MVLDTPAGLHGKRLKEILKRAHKVVVPLQPSVFDIFATQDFLNELADSARAAQAWLVQEIDISDSQYCTVRAINYSADYYAADYAAIPAKATVIN